MRKILFIIFLAISTFAFSQNPKVPEVSVNSVILPFGGELVLNASNLADGEYELVLTGPSGQQISHTVSADQGGLEQKQILDQSGNWKVRLSGQGLDLEMNVAVMPAAKQEESAALTTSSGNSDKVTEESKNQESGQAVVNTATETTDSKKEEISGKAKLETDVAVADADNQVAATDADNQEAAADATKTQTSVVGQTGSDNNKTETATNAEQKQQTQIETQTEAVRSDESKPLEAEAQTDANSTNAISTAQTELKQPLAGQTKVEISKKPEETKPEEAKSEEAKPEEVKEEVKTEEAKPEETTVVTENNENAQSNNEKNPATEETKNSKEAQSLFSDLNADIFSLQGSSLVARAGTKPVWKLDFPANSGETAKMVVETDKGVYIGHGNSLLLVDKKKGNVLARWLLSGQITSLKETPLGLDIETTVADGIVEKFSLRGNQLDKAAHFDTRPELYEWLKNEANTTNPAQRLTQDPTNPWLYLKAGLDNSNMAESKSLYGKAIEAGNSFYDLAGISRALLEKGESGLSTKAFSKALKDFASRGYDPRALTDMNLHNAYNFPLDALKASVEKGDLATSKVLAEQLKYFVSPGSPEVRKALISYSKLLKKNGEKDTAKEWLNIAKSANRSSVLNILDRIFASLGGIAWYAALSTLLAGLFLRLVLLFKYWRPQSLMLRRKQDSGKKVSPIARLFAVRYYSFTEKLVLNLLLFTTLILVALATWNSKVSQLPEAVGSGTFANASVQKFVNSSDLGGKQGSFIKGYMAQINGNKNEAEDYYKAAPNYPAALNNLAVLRGDKTLFEKVLKLAKNLPEALYNSGQKPDILPFQTEYLGSAPALVLPTKEHFQAALSGNWQDAISRVFVKPVEFLKELSAANPLKLKGKLLNTILEYLILALFLIYALWTILWLFIPRPRLARNAPRSFIYQILAFLVPGSGLADEMWGILLLVPWAIVGIDAISRFFGWGVTLRGLSLRWDIYILAAIYLINLIAIVVEFLSYRQRIIKLKTEEPELAREFNLIS